jgi:hypothetical protein
MLQPLAVPCKNYRAHPLLHSIPIPTKFDEPTTIKCDDCGESHDYMPYEIYVTFGNTDRIAS